jgi:hypothetical protein
MFHSLPASKNTWIGRAANAAALAAVVGASLMTGGCKSSAGTEAKATEMHGSAHAGDAAVCPVTGMTSEASATTHNMNKDHYSLDDWWPNRLDLSPLEKNPPAGHCHHRTEYAGCGSHPSRPGSHRSRPDRGSRN